jgi:methylmalonyl-CoA/ethylmalonyl-CoA epimerase
MPGHGDRTDTTPVPLVGRPPDQVAYVVPDLEEGVQRLGRRLGVSRWIGWRYTAAYLPRRMFRGQAGDFESHGVIAEYGPSLEIIAPLSGRSVFTEFLDAHGPGLHHLGYFVSSLAEERDRLISQGLAEVQYGGGHGMDGDGQISFFEMIDGAASYLELIEPPRRRYPPHFEILVD